MQATMASRSLQDCSSSSSDSSLIDPISNLPDAIISHILSLIPTKDAVATSILSRSWRFRWTTVTGFHFDNTGEHPKSRDAIQTMDFPEFINTVLLKHSGESIHKFVLRWESPSFRPVYPNLWTSIAISRNVRVLDLKTESTEHGSEQCEFHLPSSLYTCGNLEVLKLQGLFRVKTPNVVRLPKLVEMLLLYVIYESDQSLHSLVCGCPVLKTLDILRANDRDNLVVCSITSPVLKELSIDNQDLGPGAPSGGGDLQLIIDAPALKSLYVFDNFSSHISIKQKLTSLVDGGLMATFSPDNVVVEVLHAFGSIRDVILDEKVLKSLEIEKATVPSCFKSLIRLAINSHHLPQWSCLMHVLNSCIRLRILEIRSGESGGDPWSDPACIPSCMSSSLRLLTVTRFDGTKNEMAMLKFFLDHGLKLRRVYLSCDWDEPTIDHAKRLKIFKKVSKLSKASPTCKIYWHQYSGAVEEWES